MSSYDELRQRQSRQPVREHLPAGRVPRHCLGRFERPARAVRVRLGWLGRLFLGISRSNVADRRADPVLSAAPNLVAVVAAGTGAHASSHIPRTFSSATGT
jgi:hypothetical protein